MPQKLTSEMMRAAIAGFELQKGQMDSRIAELRSMLASDRAKSAEKSETIKPRKKRSLAVRRKMAAAQRARYAKLKAGSEPQPVIPKPKKRKLSAAGRKHIIQATKRRWAAVKAVEEGEKAALGKKAGRKKTA